MYFIYKVCLFETGFHILQADLELNYVAEANLKIIITFLT